MVSRTDGISNQQTNKITGVTDDNKNTEKRQLMWSGHGVEENRLSILTMETERKRKGRTR